MIQIIDYGAGNIKSVCNALKQLGKTYEVIKEGSEIDENAKLIFPGVGAAGSAMKNLHKSGLNLSKIKNPFLGICLGMQLLFSFSEENNVRCLNVIDGTVKKFSSNLKVPQIGWNKVSQIKKDPIFSGITNNSYFYFVNSYYVEPTTKIGANTETIGHVDKSGDAKTIDDAVQIGSTEYVLGETLYGENFSSVVKKNNFYGVQFHPEKSGEIGLKLLNNFCELC